MPDLGTTPAGTVQINGKLYVLVILNGKPAYSSGQRITQQIPSDDFELTWSNWSDGIGYGFHHASLLAARPKRLSLPPTATLVTPPTGVITSNWHDSFEEQDANGRWYKYLIGTQGILKLDITSDPPLLRQVVSLSMNAAFNASDRFGTPVRIVQGGVTYWYIPCNNGDRLVRLTTPVGVETTSAAYAGAPTLNGEISAAATSLVYTCGGDPIAAGDVLLIGTEEIWVGAVDTGTNTCSSLARGWAGTTAAIHIDTSAITKKGGLDVYAAVTTVVKGAAFFRQMPNGDINRATASHSATTFQTRAEISILTAGAAPETDANWGDDFPVDDQTKWILSLLNYHDYLVVCKQNGWFVATLQADNTLKWESILPDAEFGPATALAAESIIRGAVWHDQLFLPTDTRFWRYTGSAALPVDPDSVQPNIYEGYDTAESVSGHVLGCVAAGEWLYTSYGSITGTDGQIMAMRERRPDDAGTHPYVHIPVADPGTSAEGMSLQNNGTGAPRLLYSHGTWDKFSYISLSADRSPYKMAPGVNGSFGAINSTYDIHLNEIIFPCSVLFREWRLLIDNTNAEVSWSLWQFLDGARSGAGTAVGSARTTTGSGFWTAGTSDTATRAAFRLQATTSADYVPTGNKTAARRLTVYGYYLPDESQDMVFSIDLPATASMRGMSIDAIVAELETYVLTGAYSWVDYLGNTGYVLVREKRREPFIQNAALASDQYTHMKVSLLEYA